MFLFFPQNLIFSLQARTHLLSLFSLESDIRVEGGDGVAVVRSVMAAEG